MTKISYAIHSRAIKNQIGFVYRATELPANRPVALLVLDTQRVPPASWERLIESVRTSQWRGFPHQLELISVVEHDLYYGAIFDWFVGLSLAQTQDLVGTLPPSLIRRVAVALGKAVAGIHDAGGYHGNIHLPEIFFADDISVWLTSPSFSQFLATIREPNPALERMGSVQEAAAHEKQAFDLFRVGLVLYQLATGMELPLEENAWQSDPDFLVQVLDPTLLNPNTPASLRRIIRQAVGIRAATGSFTAAALLAEALSMPEGPPEALDIAEMQIQLSSLDPYGEKRSFHFMHAVTVLDAMKDKAPLVPWREYRSEPWAKTTPAGSGGDFAGAPAPELAEPGGDSEASLGGESAEDLPSAPSPPETTVEPAPPAGAAARLAEFLSINDVTAALLIGEEGEVREAVGALGLAEAARIGTIIATEFKGINRLARDLELKPCKAVAFEYAGGALYCRPVGEEFLVVFAASPRAIGAMRFRADHLIPELSRVR